jgi:predicted enzyme related to lactoylglutathione lyase
MASSARMVTLIPIRNMTRAIKFYTKVLDGKLLARGRGDMRNSWAAVNVGGADFWFVTPETREPRKLAYQGLLVKNIKRYVAKLQKKRVRFQRPEKMSPKTRIEGPIAWDDFGASAFFKDPEGNLLMVWQNFPPM